MKLDKGDKTFKAKEDGEKRYIKQQVVDNKGRKVDLTRNEFGREIYKKAIKEAEKGLREKIDTKDRKASFVKLAPKNLISQPQKLAAIVLYHIFSKLSLTDNENGVTKQGLARAVKKSVFYNVDNDSKAQKAAEHLVLIVVSELKDIIEEANIREGKKTPTYYRLKDEVIIDIKQLTEDKANRQYYDYPMTTKPIDWKWKGDKLVGGYKDRQIDLIRWRRGKDIEWTKQAPGILEALNIIQATPFKINKRVLEAFQRDLENEPEAQRHTAQAAIQRLRVSIWAIADEYKDEKEIYFPHNYDWRGRIYCAGAILSLQGSKENKGLIELAEGEPITDEGKKQLYAYLASVYGGKENYDKLPYKTRIKKGQELYKNKVPYSDADNPYLFLQIVDNLDRAKRGENVCTIVQIDGSCNGLQHMSALRVCASGLKATNLFESKERQDIYDEVKERLLDTLKKGGINEVVYCLKQANFKKEKERVKAIQKGDHNKSERYNNYMLKNEEAIKTINREGFNLFEDLVTRSFCKTITMVRPYGGTDYANTNTIEKYLHDKHADKYPELISKDFSKKMAELIVTEVNEIVEGGNEFEAWIKKLGEVVAEDLQLNIEKHNERISENLRVEWSTPESDGFKIRHNPYGEKKCTAEVYVNKKRNKLTFYEPDYNTINKDGIVNGISPNVIHSLDAYHLRQTLKDAHKLCGIKQFWFIHDSYGCHPNYITSLALCARTTFEEFYNDGDKVCEFTEQFLDMLPQGKLKKVGFPAGYSEPRQTTTSTDEVTSVKDIINVISNEFFFS